MIGKSKMEAVRYYRRIKTIDYKLQGKTLEWIYTKKFFLENAGFWNLNFNIKIKKRKRNENC